MSKYTPFPEPPIGFIERPGGLTAAEMDKTIRTIAADTLVAVQRTEGVEAMAQATDAALAIVNQQAASVGGFAQQAAGAAATTQALATTLAGVSLAQGAHVTTSLASVPADALRAIVVAGDVLSLYTRPAAGAALVLAASVTLGSGQNTQVTMRWLLDELAQRDARISENAAPRNVQAVASFDAAGMVLNAELAAPWTPSVPGYVRARAGGYVGTSEALLYSTVPALPGVTMRADLVLGPHVDGSEFGRGAVVRTAQGDVWVLCRSDGSIIWNSNGTSVLAADGSPRSGQAGYTGADGTLLRVEVEGTTWRVWIGPNEGALLPLLVSGQPTQTLPAAPSSLGILVHGAATGGIRRAVVSTITRSAISSAVSSALAPRLSRIAAANHLRSAANGATRMQSGYECTDIVADAGGARSGGVINALAPAYVVEGDVQVPATTGEAIGFVVGAHSGSAWTQGVRVFVRGMGSVCAIRFQTTAGVWDTVAVVNLAAPSDGLTYRLRVVVENGVVTATATPLGGLPVTQLSRLPCAGSHAGIMSGSADARLLNHAVYVPTL